MERALYIKKFRNIGLKEDDKTRLVLNYSLEKGKMGNLVILIGANNSGKSNVLDALMAFGAKTIDPARDLTEISIKDNDQIPEVGLSCKGVSDDEKYGYSYVYGQSERSVELPKSYKLVEQKLSNDLGTLTRELGNFISYFERYHNLRNGLYYGFSRNVDRSVYNSKTWLQQQLDAKTITLEALTSNVETLLKSFVDSNVNGEIIDWDNYTREYPDSSITKRGKWLKSSKSKYQTLEALYSERYGYNFMPEVKRYVETPITNSNISCTVDKLKTNPFFISLFKKVGYKMEEILKMYETFKTKNYKGMLTDQADEINEKLKELSKNFNKMYFSKEKDAEYQFLIDLESNRVEFEIKRGNKSLNLDHQSTGFKWFFNLYFNFLLNNTLSAGDIIIMDEPATNLHVLGVVELRKFLKEFAVKNDLTIVLATHLPYMLDPDYLDEVRMITTQDRVVHISNDFAAYHINDPDSLRPIKEALTVKTHYILDPEKSVVFVDGITDYN